MNPEVRVSLSPRHDRISLEGGHLVDDGFMLRLVEGTAALVLDEVDGVSTASELAERTAARYPDDAARVRADVLGFVEQLAHLGIVDVVAPPPEAGYVTPAHIGFVEEDGVGVLMNMAEGRRRALSPSAVLVWELVTKLHYRSAVLEELRQRMPDAPASMSEDVDRLLEDLVSQEYLVQRGAVRT
jgi:hypothetical protein